MLLEGSCDDIKEIFLNPERYVIYIGNHPAASFLKLSREISPFWDAPTRIPMSTRTAPFRHDLSTAEKIENEVLKVRFNPKYI